MAAFFHDPAAVREDDAFAAPAAGTQHRLGLQAFDYAPGGLVVAFVAAIERPVHVRIAATTGTAANAARPGCS